MGPPRVRCCPITLFRRRFVRVLYLDQSIEYAQHLRAAGRVGTFLFLFCDDVNDDDKKKNVIFSIQGQRRPTSVACCVSLLWLFSQKWTLAHFNLLFFLSLHDFIFNDDDDDDFSFLSLALGGAFVASFRSI